MKQQKLNELLKQYELDALVILSPYNRRYLSGFTGTSGGLVITTKKSYLLTDFRYTQQAEKQAQGFEVILQQSSVIQSIVDFCKEKQLETIGFEGDLITYQQYKALADQLTVIDIAGEIEKIRMIKAPHEIELIQKAADIADEAYAHILEFVKPGMTEMQVNNELEHFMRSKGASGSSFDTIVASGYRGALPHGVASEKVIENHEMVTLDYGAIYQGYVSDITRTFAVGEPLEEMRKIYDIVLEAEMTALKEVRAGMTEKEADDIARNIIKSAGYGDNFGHSLGHGIGLEVHEGPYLAQKGEMKLVENMCVTLEPGIYVDGLGGVRIEDDVLVTENGLKRFTQSTKDLIIL